MRFVREVIGVKPTPYQEDILRHFVERRRVAVRGPHGLGKTALSSWVVLWGITAFADDVKIVTTASAWRQLIYFTWPEIKKWAAKSDWKKAGITLRQGKELLERSIKMPGKEAFPVASNTPALIEGAHAQHLIYVFDEAKAIPVGSWDAAEGAFSGAGTDTAADAYALAISTPGDPSGRFYDIHKRKPGLLDWWARHVTVDEAIAAGRVSAEWVDAKRKLWGETSPIFQNRVLGEFAESGEDSVIPLSWAEKAVERWHDCEGKGEGDSAYGVDVARYGDDRSVIAHAVGSVIEDLDIFGKYDTMETTGRVTMKADKFTPIYVDVIGIGAGVVDRLNELEYNVTGINVGTSTTDTDDASGELRFNNLRSRLWWMLRERLDPDGDDPLAIPPNDELIGDLTAPTWKPTSAGKIQVESKDDIRKRIGRSTDLADAVALAVYATTSRMGDLVILD